jgi:hypothetical protein
MVDMFFPFLLTLFEKSNKIKKIPILLKCFPAGVAGGMKAASRSNRRKP